MMDATIQPESIVHSTNDIQLHLTKLAVSGFTDNASPPGNLFVELEVDGTRRHRCVMEWQSAGTLVSESLSDVTLVVTPSSFIDCELWYESEDKVNQSKLCECTVKITDAVCHATNGCEHKSNKHEWNFELHGSPLNEYALPSNVDEAADGLVEELRQTFKSLHGSSTQIPRLSGDQWMRQEEFDIAWQFFSFAYRNYHDVVTQSNRAALDDAVKDTLTQLRLGLELFESRAKQSVTSRRALYWYDGLDLVSQSVIQAAALLHKYTLDLASASSRLRSLFLDRCQQLQDDIIRYRLMFIQNGSSARPLQRDVEGDTLSTLMGLMVSSTEYDDVLLSLRGRQAGRALELLQDEIFNIGSDSPAVADNTSALAPNEIRRRLRVLLEQVAQLSDRIPPSLFVDGVKWNSEVLSRTKFSDVTSGTYKKDRVVIKRIKLPIKNVATDSSQRTKTSLLRVLGWKTLKHEFLLPFLGVAVKKPGKDSDGLHLVYPRTEYSNIISVLSKKGTTDQDVVILINRWLLEIAEGMCYLHGENLVHGDLRARNILVDRNYNIRIADFGLPALAEEAGVNYMSAHPTLARWLAPELLASDSAHMPARQTFASDVYAFACVCSELYTCDVPFARVPDKQIASLVLKGTRPERPSTPGNDSEPMTTELWTIVQQCWAADAPQRPKAYALVESITAFVNGGKAADVVGLERPTAPIADEPEQMSSRSGSPETFTSEFSTQPDTPIDSPVKDGLRDARFHSIEDYSPVVQMAQVPPIEKATLDDVPPPPYERVGPTLRPPHMNAPAEEKAKVESPSDAQDTRITTESSAEAIPSSVTTHDEELTTNAEESAHMDVQVDHDQAQAAEEPATSGTIHDDNHDAQRGDDVKERQSIPSSLPEPESQLPVEENPKPDGAFTTADATPVDVKPTSTEADSVALPPVSDPSNDTAAPHAQPAAQDASKYNSDTSTDEVAPEVSHLPSSPEKAIADPIQPETQAADVATNPTTAEDHSPVEEACQIEDNTGTEDITSSAITELPVEPLAPTTGLAPTESPRPTVQVEEKQDTVGGVKQVSQEHKPVDVAPVPATLEVSETKEMVIDNAQDTSEAEESAETTDVQEVKASAKLEHDEQLPVVPDQVASLPTAPTTAAGDSVDSDAPKNAEGEAQETHNEAVSSEAPPTHEASVTDVKDGDAEHSKVEQIESGNQGHAEAQRAVATENGSHEDAKVAAAPEDNAHPVSASEYSASTTNKPEPESEKANGNSQAHADTLIDAGNKETAGTDGTQLHSPSAEVLLSLDAEFSPPPDPASWNTSVARRASIRLVNPPAVASSSEDLPTVDELNNESHTEAQTTPTQPTTLSDSIQQESRKTEPAAQGQSPVTNGASSAQAVQNNQQSQPRTAAKTSTKGKSKNKAPKDTDEIQAGCKCIIM